MASLWCEVTVDAVMVTVARSLWVDNVKTRTEG